MSALTTASPVAGGIAHTLLSITCILGLATFIFNAPPLRASSVEGSSVLGNSIHQWSNLSLPVTLNMLSVVDLPSLNFLSK
ncbi:hypothetical protein BD410DRAFT_795832 [Rickenella mellea]|uniref:Uncharacterized protein n=1 Tax=Rickenella mellea TaxID=50990 RepID=A0A4Y7PN48_9AGAM|nr:hypothetical protein BD410DRAFT_795832 [Rickenella mellea]